MKILSGNSKNEEERLNEHEYERINEFNTVGRRILWTNKEEETEDVKSKKKKNDSMSLYHQSLKQNPKVEKSKETIRLIKTVYSFLDASQALYV